MKTRGNLFAELSRELQLHIKIERRDVIPVLRSADGTKRLVSEAEKTSKELLAKMNDLKALPKGDETFLARLAELRKLFQQQRRDERKELATIEERLPDERADTVGRKIEDRLARAEDEERGGRARA